jgi:cephalosporin hydroxylase
VCDLIATRFLVDPAHDFWADYPHPTPGQTWARHVLADGLWMYPTWLGFPVLKWPTDLAWLQALLVEEPPAVVIETGLFQGGGTIFLASILDQLGAGEVISVELRPDPAVLARLAAHPLGKRITVVPGDSAARATVAEVTRLVAGRGPVTAILDSDHSTTHVLAELEAYAPLVDSKLIAMDTSLAFLPEHAASNPHHAVRAFLAAHPDSWRISPRAGSPLVTLAEDGILERLPAR